MTKKIFRSIVLVAVCALLASLLLIMGCLYDYFTGLQSQALRDELTFAASGVSQSGEGYLDTLSSSQYRLTWIAADGTVLYDTQADAASMENHASREEVQQALATGEGESSRYSQTLLEKTIYVAKRLPDGTVLRISVLRQTLAVLLLGMLQPVLVVALAAVILSALLARRLARRIVEPLNAIDLDHPLDANAYDEVAPLLRRIERQHRQIDDQLLELQRKTDEFTHITQSMPEGLVLLDNKGAVLSINPAARKLFGAEDSCVGQDFLTLDRSLDVTQAIARAKDAGHSETRAELSGRIYQFDISRIDSGGETIGAVLLCFDITEHETAEQARREFTANVSHELKTPLQGIIGSAELIENGMVRPDDLPRFVGHIHAEAARLVTLIDDIIRLSQLDEGDAMPTEPVDLLAVSQEAAENLHDAAAARSVTVSVTGQSAVIPGVRRLLYEVVYNLCDNAIKYNRDGGRVDVTVAADAGGSSITVADTGIGIAPEHQSRVFERFYRVDKSHSRAIGGTGLGLSIVKHAAAYHHARVALESTLGTGTTVTVTFPRPGEA